VVPRRALQPAQDDGAQWRACLRGRRRLTIGALKPREKAMDKFTTLTGIAAPLPMINVDTDKIIPKQYLKTIERTGLGKALFDELRHRPDGSDNPDFVLNQPAYRQAKILVAGENFGCGSSREHAPWALLDFGIRCVISSSFADIFYNNCFKNGILPIKLPQETVDALMDDAQKGANARLTIDLERQVITRPDGEEVSFEIDPFRKHCLLNGLDDVGLTLRKEQAISAFETKNRQSQPWLWA
jgi:3-isopropylmalate/(R)-2-methylmalate dehydratase small subunit